MPSRKTIALAAYLVLSLTLLPYLIFDGFLREFARTNGVDFVGLLGFDALVILVLTLVSLLRSDKL